MPAAPAIPVVEPDTPEEVARALADASASRTGVMIRGGGTKSSWGRDAAAPGAVLSMRRLSRVLAYAEDDLTVTCEAGVTLETLNGQLGQRGQWLPIDSAFEAATIGGILATNDSGALRHRFGTPRDLLIGVRLATTDGRLVRAGGQVVKNVAGYDLGKLVTGSFGGLAAIVSATFKLTPLPAAFATQRVTFADRIAAVEAATALASAQLDPIALDVHFHAERAERPIEILVRYGSTGEVVQAQMADTERMVMAFKPLAAARAVAADDASVWRLHGQRLWSGGGSIVRVSWLPASLGQIMALLDDLRRQGTAVELIGRAAIGAGLLRLDGDAPAQIAMVRTLRERVDVFNQSTVLRAPAELKAAIDVWGAAGSTARIFGAIKRALDPTGVLNPGRGPI
jgi:glycolate oxidase FAD binding subunit